MHKTKLLFMMVLVNAVVFLGCTAQQTSQSNAPVSSGTPLVKMPLEEDHAALAAVPRISVTEAEALVKKGEAILLDAREESAAARAAEDRARQAQTPRSLGHDAGAELHLHARQSPD
jgi:Na+-transporting methylmalonyl-CoA/oxaloacetate decarboxylase gamma subunit